MTPAELIAKCDEQLALAGEKAEISLKLPGSYGKGTKRLCPGGPIGRVASEVVPASVLVFFSAQEVKDFALTHTPQKSQTR